MGGEGDAQGTGVEDPPRRREARNGQPIPTRTGRDEVVVPGGKQAAPAPATPAELGFELLLEVTEAFRLRPRPLPAGVLVRAVDAASGAELGRGETDDQGRARLATPGAEGKHAAIVLSFEGKELLETYNGRFLSEDAAPRFKGPLVRLPKSWDSREQLDCREPVGRPGTVALSDLLGGRVAEGVVRGLRPGGQGTPAKPWRLLLDFAWDALHLELRYFDTELKREAALPLGLRMQAKNAAGEVVGEAAVATYGGALWLPIFAPTERSELRLELCAGEQAFLEQQAKPAAEIRYCSPAAGTGGKQIDWSALTPLQRRRYYPLPAEWSSAGQLARYAGSTEPAAEILARARPKRDRPIRFHLDDVVVLSGAQPLELRPDERLTLFDHVLAIRTPREDEPYLSAVEPVHGVIPGEVYGRAGEGRSHCLRLVRRDGTCYDVLDAALLPLEQHDGLRVTSGARQIGARAAWVDERRRATGRSRLHGTPAAELLYLHELDLDEDGRPFGQLLVIWSGTFDGSALGEEGPELEARFKRALHLARYWHECAHPAQARRERPPTPKAVAERQQEIERLRAIGDDFRSSTGAEREAANEALEELAKDPAWLFVHLDQPRGRERRLRPRAGGEGPTVLVRFHFEALANGQRAAYPWRIKLVSDDSGELYGGTRSFMRHSDRTGVFAVNAAIPAWERWHTTDAFDGRGELPSALAHEIGHGIGLIDEYPERWAPTDGGRPGEAFAIARQKWHGNHVSPFFWDANSLMNGNRNARLRHLWAFTAWLNTDGRTKDLLGASYVVECPTAEKAVVYDLGEERDYFLHPDVSAIGFEPTPRAGRMDLFCYRVGHDESFAELVAPECWSGEPFDRLIVIQVKARVSFSEELSAEQQREFLNDLSLAFRTILQGDKRLQERCMVVEGSRCCAYVSTALLVDTTHAPSSVHCDLEVRLGDGPPLEVTGPTRGSRPCIKTSYDKASYRSVARALLGLAPLASLDEKGEPAEPPPPEALELPFLSPFVGARCERRNFGDFWPPGGPAKRAIEIREMFDRYRLRSYVLRNGRYEPEV